MISVFIGYFVKVRLGFIDNIYCLYFTVLLFVLKVSLELFLISL